MPPGLGDSLEPRCYVDAVTVDIVAFDDDVAEVYADTQMQLVRFAQRGVAGCELTLNVHGALEGANDARELQKRAIAH